MSTRKPHEHFICENCFNIRVYPDRENCMIHTDKTISRFQIACSEFHPCHGSRDSYHIYVLESRVEKLEAVVGKLELIVCELKGDMKQHE